MGHGGGGGGQWLVERGPGWEDPEDKEGEGRALGSFCSHVEYTAKLGDIFMGEHASRMAIEIPVQDIVIHQDYNPIGLIENDIALALLEFPVNFSSNVQPVCLPKKAFMVQGGTECWVTGWGKLNEAGKTEARREARARQGAASCPAVGLQAQGGGREAIFKQAGEGGGGGEKMPVGSH